MKNTNNSAIVKRFKRLLPTYELTFHYQDGVIRKSFGPKIARLCAEIKRTGTMGAAGEAIGMSRTATINAFAAAESELGFRLLERHPATGCTLTPEGERLLNTYAKVTNELDECFYAIFSDAIEGGKDERVS